jgi:drug/metabolite transporter (DMT)-like permease
MSRGQKLGMAALLGYCVATAVSATWVSFSFTGISGPAITFVTFALAQVIYLARAGKNLPAVFSFAMREWKDVILLNIFTLSSWLFMFMALQRTEASVESAAYQGAVAVTAFILARFLAGQRFRLVTCAGLSCAAATLALLVAVRLLETGSTPVRNPAVGEGLALALVAGTTGGCYIFRSSSLHRRANVAPTSVLCVRFLLLLAVTAALSAQGVLRLGRSDPAMIGRLLALSVAFVVLPTFLLQFAIAHLPSVRVSILTPLVPVIALGSEYVARPWGSGVVPLLVVGASIALIFTNQTLPNGRDGRGAVSQPGREAEDAAAVH